MATCGDDPAAIALLHEAYQSAADEWRAINSDVIGALGPECGPDDLEVHQPELMAAWRQQAARVEGLKAALLTAGWEPESWDVDPETWAVSRRAPKRIG